MRDFRLVLLVCILTVGSFCHDGFGESSEPATGPGKAERTDLLPKKVRWQTLSADVCDVKIDRQGRPWFHISHKGKISVAQFKRQVERAAKLKAPWFSGGRIALFDSTGRIWLLPYADRKLLLGYDPESGKWIERRVAPAKDWSGYNENHHQSRKVWFTMPAHQSKTGSLYFSDRLGVHVLTKGRWSYQHLYKLNIKHKLYVSQTKKSFYKPRFAEDAAGRVYVWTSWRYDEQTGTVGFFVHDGKTWTHHLICDWRQAPGPANTSELNRLEYIVPLTGRRAMVSTGGPAFIVTTQLDAAMKKRIQEDIILLGDNFWKVREAAHERLERLGLVVRPMLNKALKQYKDPEIVVRLQHIIRAGEWAAKSPTVDGYTFHDLRVWCVDAEGNTWLVADQYRRPDGRMGRGILKISPQGKISPLPKYLHGWYYSARGILHGRDGRVYFACYVKCAVFDGEKIFRITDDMESRYRYILGRDADGRVYFSDGQRVAAFRFGYPDVRPTLPTTIYEVPRGRSMVCLDSTGRLWAVVFNAKTRKPQMAWFGPNGWNPADLPGGIKTQHTNFRLFQPLKRGFLVVQGAGSDRAFLFNGDEWETYANLRELVEKRHSLLAKLLDNQRWGNDYYAKLRVDDKGRVWVVEWTKAAAYDGKRWIDLRGPLVKVNSDADAFYFCISLERGKKMLVDNRGVFVMWIDNGRVRIERPKPPLPRRGIGNHYAARTGMWFDRQGRLWIPRDSGSCFLVDGKHPKVVENTGFPRFADSAGRVWFLNQQHGKLVVLAPNGRRAELKNEWLQGTIAAVPAAVAEDAPGSVWVSTRLGLLHVRVRSTDKGIVLQPVKHYERGVPKGDCWKMFVDKYRNLWFGPQNGRLYRVQLPKNSLKPACSGR